jgi:hypothetical protein
MLDFKSSAIHFRQTLKAPPLIRLYDYWWSKSVDNRIPSRAQIDPLDVPDLLPTIFLVDVIDTGSGPGFRFRLVGSKITDVVGSDPTGLCFENFYNAANFNEVVEIYSKVVSRCEPFSNTTTAPFPDKDYVRFTRLLLPLSKQGERVDMILGCLYFENV